MTKFQFSISSTTYKKHIFQGFSRLQQSDEFVDMTLAAEGHWVKVHQTIVALASPYLKELIQSVPSQHPVIFLNGVTHEVLCFILEYMYSGEVQIPSDKVQLFLNAAQALSIAGIKNIVPSAEDEKTSQEMHNINVCNANESRQPLPAITENVTIIDQNNFDLQVEEPAMELLYDNTENQKNSLLPFSFDAPILLDRNNESQNITNFNTHGNSINISLEDSVSNDNITQKPVAKIEILSNTILNSNLNANVTMNDQSQLPQLYAEALVNIKKQTLSMNNEINISMDNHTSGSQMDSSQLILNVGSNFPMPNNSGMSQDINLTSMTDCANINLTSMTDCANITAPQIGQYELSNLSNGKDINDIDQENKESDILQYAISTRGALLLIMDHFMYYCHYQRDHGRKRRWRCIDYRGSRCLAAIDTVGEEIVSRKHKHGHPNHDKKIMKKCKTKIFSTIKLAQDCVKVK